MYIIDRFESEWAVNEAPRRQTFNFPRLAFIRGGLYYESN